MFGLSIKDQLFNLIIAASEKALVGFENDIEAFYLDYNDLENEEDIIVEYQKVLRRYLDAVSNDVISIIHDGPSSISARLSVTLYVPSRCGYPDIDFRNGLRAGSLYALCFYAHKNKPANPKDCIFLNHYQNNLIDSVLVKLDAKITKNAP